MRARERSLWRLAGRLWLYARSRPFTWIEPERLAACRYPRGEAGVERLARRGIRVLVNLHERPNAPTALAAYGVREVHLPVPDFTAPSMEQLRLGVAAIADALAEGERVAVHCGAGLGRTGTLLACLLVARGLEAEEAIARVRGVRPGSIETPAQEAAVAAYAADVRRR